MAQAGHAVNPAPRSGPAAGGCAFGRLRSSASQAKRPHPWGLGRRIHAPHGPACRLAPASDSFLRARNESRNSRSKEEAQSRIKSSANRGWHLPSQIKLDQIPAALAGTCPEAEGMAVQDRWRHGPGACAGRVGQDAQPRSCRVRRTAHTSKAPSSPHGWVYGVSCTAMSSASPHIRKALLWLWLWLWLLTLILLLTFCPFGRPSVGVHQGISRVAPFGEAEHIERRS